MPVSIVQATVSGTKPRLFASIDAVNKSDNAGSFRGRLFGVLFFFSLYDHGANLYGFMTYLEAATETKGLEDGQENWAGFYANPVANFVKNSCEKRHTNYANTKPIFDKLEMIDYAKSL